MVPLIEGGNMEATMDEENEAHYQTVPSVTPHSRDGHLQLILNSNDQNRGEERIVFGENGNFYVNELQRMDTGEEPMNEDDGEEDDDDIIYGLPECYIEVCILGNGAFGTVMYCNFLTRPIFLLIPSCLVWPKIRVTTDWWQ